MTERDRDIEQALRGASHEMPPVALDEAIRAAARREVGAGPRRSRAARWWFPLAAAAAVAVIAFGVVQLTPQERIAPTVATDMPSARRAAKQPGASTGAPAPPPAAPVEQRADSAKLNLPAVAPAQRAMPMTQPPPVSAPRQPAAEPMQKLDASRDAVDVAGPKPARQRDVLAGQQVAPPVARSEPFPAAPAAAGGAAADALASTERKASATPAPALMPAPALNGASRTEAANGTAESDRAARPAALGKVAATDAPRAKDALRPADEWIAAIRKLKSEGRAEEAAKELAAFRATYKERADTLLPDDLKPPKP